MTALLLGFVGTAAVVALAGIALARHGDVIAARTRLGGLWVGSVFLAVATSLPELTTDISAVRIGAPDLAAGDLFGSSMANMLILALLNLVPRTERLFGTATLDHVLYAALAIIMTCIAAIAILIRAPVSLFGVGPGPVVLLVTYGVGSWAIFRHTALARRAVRMTELSAPDQPAGGEAASTNPASLRRSVWSFVAASIVILIAAPLFAHSAAGLAQATGLGSTFFGTLLVGLTTSLPELVTSLAAVRLRAYDLAVGNLFGSNALNMAMFLPLDLAQPAAPILAVVSPVHALSSLIAIVLMGTGLAALVYRSRGRFAVLEPSSAVMILMYVVGLALVFLQTKSPAEF